VLSLQVFIASGKPSNKLHPFATDMAFGAYLPPTNQAVGSSRFYPPHCYQASQAGISSLLRNHLPPHTASIRLGFLLVLLYSAKHGNSARLPRLRQAPGEQSHPQSRIRNDQVSGFALFWTLTLLIRRIRFAYAMYRSLPIASFRPCRYQQRPCDSDCLPPGRGDACLTQAGFARHAGQTKKPNSSSAVRLHDLYSLVAYFFFLRMRPPRRPTSPVPKRSMVAGSGTGALSYSTT